MKTRVWLIIGLLAAIIALPIGLRRETSTVSPDNADDRLTILTPHNESIRQEFGDAFAAYWKKKTGRSLYMDWRSPGGTSEIRMVIDAGFKAAEETGREGIGADLFFGGGEPDFASQAKKGRLLPLEVFNTHPEWFDENGVIPESFSGERYYPPDKVWISTCTSQFGICYNPDVLQRLGLPEPTRWDDLGDPRYVGSLAFADPTKSGSVARAFELLVQSEIQRELAKPGAVPETAIEAGWAQGLQLIQKIGANSRYFTDNASKVPQDVGQGNAAAGLCIDFYGRSYTMDLTTRDGHPRIKWIAPQAGTALSGDPVGVLKGAPNPKVAQAFVEFCLTPEAQQLWFGKPGTPGGPKNYALHRTPVRKDLYTPEILANTTMPSAHPYTDTGNFSYKRELTGSAFNTLRNLIKIICIDSHEELKSAWHAMADAGMPPEALAVFSDVSIIPYSVAGKGDPGLDSPDALKAAERATELGERFRANYRRAEAIARAAKAKSASR